MFIVSDILNWLLSVTNDYIYIGIFIAAFVETVFPPIPIVMLLPFIGYVAFQSKFNLLDIILLGTIGGAGSTMGSLVLYLLALKLGRKTIFKFYKYSKISERNLNLIERWFRQYGYITVLICRLIPILRETVSIFAGIFDMDKKIFFIYTFIGSSLLNIILLLIGYYFNGDFQSFIKTYF